MTRRSLRLAPVLVALALVAPTAGAAPVGGPPELLTVLAAEGEALIATVDIGGAGLVLPMGIARATLAGDQAQASANAVDYALAATLFGVLAGEGTEFPGPVKATSDGPADASRSTTFPALGPVPEVVLGPLQVGPTLEEAHVGAGPSARSSTEVVPVRLAGTAEVAGASSATDLGPELATARVSLAELRLTDALVLRGVEWWASAGAERSPAAGFRVGSLLLAGIPIPLGPDGLSGDAASSLLAGLGVHLEAPVVTIDGPRAEVSPLVVRYSDSPLAAATIGELYAALSPALIELLDAVRGIVPESGYALYVANIVLASLAGFGELRIEVGGAAASYELRSFTDPATAPDDVAATEPPPPGPPAGGIGTGPALGDLPTGGAATPRAPLLSASPVAGRRLADRVPDLLVGALALAGGAGILLLAVGRRRRAGSSTPVAGGATP